MMRGTVARVIVIAALALGVALMVPALSGEALTARIAERTATQPRTGPQAQAQAPAAEPAPASFGREIMRTSTSGPAAVAALGTRLPAVASGHGWTAEELTKTLLEDPTLRVDSTDHLFYVEPKVESAVASSTVALAADPLAAAPYPLADTFSLHSLPGAKLTILLDFGPRTMSGNKWTSSYSGGADIVCPPFSLDSNPAFSDAEKTIIQDVWRRVAEDYAPFNVDVTTQFTSEAAITRSGPSDTIYGTRVLITPIGSYFSGGGIAYVGVFADTSDYYKPALVFPENLGNDAKSIAEAASHECGHNLNLQHDGTLVPVQDYYGGSGSGDMAWAPIMGVGYYRNLTQWSRGEYPSASNKEDDIAIVKGFLAYRPDDAGDTAATASAMPTSTTLSAAGRIGSASDVDVYRFVSGAGPATINVTPAPVGPNLDVLAEIRSADGTVISSSSPATLLSASLTTTLGQGTYYLFVRGTGKGSPLDAGGYSSYGSVGTYTVSGTVAPTTSGPVAVADWAAISPDTTLTVAAPGVLGNDTNGGGGSLTATLTTNPGHGTLLLSSTGAYTYRPVSGWSGTDSFMYRVFNGTTYSAPVAVTIQVSAVLPQPTVFVLPRAAVSVTTPSSVKRAKSFYVSGELPTVHAAGTQVTLRIERFYRRRWRVVKRATVAVPPGSSSFSYRSKLSTRGSWRVVASHVGDGVVDTGSASAVRRFRVR